MLQSRPSFNVQNPDRSLKDGIKHAFLERRLIDLQSPPEAIKANDGKFYEVVFDSLIVTEDKKLHLCLCSFQQHITEAGVSNVVVIRTYREKHVH